MELHKDNLPGKSVTVLGAQRSGIAAAKLLKQAGAQPFLSDTDAESLSHEQKDELKILEIGYETGEHTKRVYLSDLVVISPGIPDSAEVVKECTRRKITLISEIELASWFVTAPVLAITGSNGKTTTTSLVAEFLNNTDFQSVLCGNVGNSFAGVVSSTSPDPEDRIYVVEVSSFQLERVPTFKPYISVILNITPDHLDRYPSFEAYRLAKLNITGNQVDSDYFVCNADDPQLRDVQTNARKITFSTTTSEVSGDFTWNGETILFQNDPFIPFADCTLRGKHNLANILAGLNATTPLINPINQHRMLEHFSQVLRSFTGIEHRLEFVKTVNGVDYYNDSKATNIDAVKYAIESFSHPVILILGGYDKNGDFTQLIPGIRQCVKQTIAIGKAREVIRKALENKVELTLCEDLEEAVDFAASIANQDDVVLLSPACASFDQYNNYEERGKHFKSLVNAL